MNSLESRFFDKLEFIKHKGLPASVVWGSSAGAGTIQGTQKIALPSGK